MASRLRSSSSSSLYRLFVDTPLFLNPFRPSPSVAHLQLNRHASSAVSRFNVKGLFVATYTPMHDNGDINPDVVPHYVDHLMRNGASGVFVNGTAGEGLMMTMAERIKMADAWIAACKNKLKVIIHCGALSIRVAEELANHAEQKGVDAISAIPSFYFSPRTPVDLVRNLKPIAAAAPKTPFLYYHIPRLTHVDIDMSSFLKVAKPEIPTLAGMKYSGFDIAGALKCHIDHGEEFEILWGRDDVMLSALAVGINSFIGGSYSFTGAIAERIVKAYEAGDMTTALVEQKRLKRIMDLTLSFGDQVTTFKALTSMVTMPLGPTRAPLKTLTPEETSALRMALEKEGCFDWMVKSA